MKDEYIQDGSVAEASTGTIAVAIFIGWGPDGPMVRIADEPRAVQTGVRTRVPLGDADLGCALAVAREAGDTVILGRMATPGRFASVAVDVPTLTVDSTPTPLEITAEREIVLRCGKASITLTREGKIILRGTYISSRSSGVNRIKGGSVQLN